MIWAALLGCVMVAIAIGARVSTTRRRARLRQSVMQVDRGVTPEYYRARRAMNDAAGQGWRNLADEDPSQ